MGERLQLLGDLRKFILSAVTLYVGLADIDRTRDEHSVATAGSAEGEEEPQKIRRGNGD